MKFEIGDKVKIIDNGILGEVIDTTIGGDKKIYYLVETDEAMVTDNPRAYNAPYPIFTCSPDEIEPI